MCLSRLNMPNKNLWFSVQDTKSFSPRSQSTYWPGKREGSRGARASSSNSNHTLTGLLWVPSLSGIAFQLVRFGKKNINGGGSKSFSSFLEPAFKYGHQKILLHRSTISWSKDVLVSRCFLFYHSGICLGMLSRKKSLIRHSKSLRISLKKLWPGLKKVGINQANSLVILNRKKNWRY